MAGSKRPITNSQHDPDLSNTLDMVRKKVTEQRAEFDANCAATDRILAETLQKALEAKEGIRLKQLELAQSNNGATTTPQTISTGSATPPSSLVVARQGWSGPAPTLAKKTRSADAEHRSRCSLM